jgi:O-antigen/teichoic acid export membrane protein/glycosyltransferase involved in cell wall biosynthesis/pimeloyl-ACP methyl ester carboxylesterase
MTDPTTNGDEGRPDERTLGALVRNSLGWSFANNVAGRSLTFVSSLVLARLLEPRQFGVFAIALVVYSLLISLNDVGIYATIVRWPGDLDEVAPTATTLIFLTSLVAYGVFFVLAPYCCRLVGAPGATSVSRLLALAIIVDGIFAVPVGMLTRYFRQDLRTIADLVNSAVATVISIVLAVKGYGVWSLAWGRLLGNLVGAILCMVYSKPRYRPGFRLGAAKRLLRNGAPLLGTTVITIGVFNVDYLTIGRVLGPTSLGYYVLAFNVSSWAINIFSFAVDRVTLPTFARLGNNPVALRQTFIRGTTFLCLFTFPVCMLMAAMNHPLVLFMYGARWGPSTQALEFLALFAIVRIVQDLAMETLIAVGKSPSTLLLQSVWLIVLIPVLATGAHLDGITGVAIGHALVGFLIVLPLYGLAIRRLGVPIKSLLGHLAWPLAGAAVTAVVARVVSDRFHTPFVALLVGGTCGLLVYSLAVFPTRRMLRSSEGSLEIEHAFPGERDTSPSASPESEDASEEREAKHSAALLRATDLLGTVDALPVWFGSLDRPLFGWLHVPEKPSARGGVVLCPSLGIEGRRAHVAYRILAAALARKGFLVLRFDYDGTGDSAGGDDDPSRVAAWTSSVRQAAQFVERTGATRLAVVGMRMGATIAVNASIESDIDALVLWDPCTSGRRYLREQQLLLKVIDPAAKASGDSVELPGQVLSASAATDLAALQLGALPKGVAKSLLILERAGQRVEAETRDYLAGEGAEWAEATGQRELLEAVTPFDEPPLAAIGRICDWLEGVIDDSRAPVMVPALSERGVVGRTADGKDVTERVAQLGPVGLVGIVTEAQGAPVGPLVVFLNDGHENHVGPARLWVNLSRAWAALGVQSVRVDISGIGDSPLRAGQQERVSYPPEIFDDVADVAFDLRPTNPSDIVLIGVCSGAFHAIDCGIAMKVRGVCAINPWLVHCPRGVRRTGEPTLPWSVERLTWLHPRLPNAILLAIAQVFPRRSAVGSFMLLDRNGTRSLVICGDGPARQFSRLIHWRRTSRRLAGTFRLEHVAGLQHSVLNARQRETVMSLITDFVCSLSPDSPGSRQQHDGPGEVVANATTGASAVADSLRTTLISAQLDLVSDHDSTTLAPLQLRPTPAAQSQVDKQGLYVICAGTPFDGHRFSEHQLADPLSRRVPVLYVDPPMSVLGEAGKSMRPKLTEISGQLWHLSIPTPPGPHRRLLAGVAGVVMRRGLHNAIETLGYDVAVVMLATTTPLFGASHERLRVLWGTDDLVAGAELMGVSVHRLQAEERKRLREADLAMTVSTALADRWRAAGVQASLFPNGVDYDLFAACDATEAPEDVTLPSPIAGYFGQLSDRIDIQLLEAVAARGHSLLLVGPCQPTFNARRLRRLLAFPNVQWVGGRTMVQLSSYLGLIDVGLVPYTNTRFNRGSFPLKTLEYLAGGRAVVSTSLPAVDLLDTDLVTCAEGGEAFADAVSSHLGRPVSPELYEARRRLARAHSWERRVEELLDLIARATTGSGGDGQTSLLTGHSPGPSLLGTTADRQAP